MLHMSDMSFVCCTLYLNADVSQFAITIRRELLIMQLITNLLVILRMAELAMGEAIGIVATLFVSFYYSRKQMQKLSIDIETKVLSTIIVKHESEGLYEKSDKEKLDFSYQFIISC